MMIVVVPNLVHLGRFDYRMMIAVVLSLVHLGQLDCRKMMELQNHLNRYLPMNLLEKVKSISSKTVYFRHKWNFTFFEFTKYLENLMLEWRQGMMMVFERSQGLNGPNVQLNEHLVIQNDCRLNERLVIQNVRPNVENWIQILCIVVCKESFIERWYQRKQINN